MNFVEVKELPRPEKKNSILTLLEDFMDANIKIAKIDFDESDYVSTTSCHSALRKACIYGNFPIRVKTINKELYLIRKDM